MRLSAGQWFAREERKAIDAYVQDRELEVVVVLEGTDTSTGSTVQVSALSVCVLLRGQCYPAVSCLSYFSAHLFTCVCEEREANHVEDMLACERHLCPDGCRIRILQQCARRISDLST